MTHTPAPWEYELSHTHKGSGILYFQINAEHHAICTNQFCYADEAQANARLISAAPELLEGLINSDSLLHEIADYLDGVSDCGEIDGETGQETPNKEMVLLMSVLSTLGENEIALKKAKS